MKAINVAMVAALAAGGSVLGQGVASHELEPAANGLCQIISVASWKTHANGPWPIVDDDPYGGFVVTEPRLHDLEWIEITFDQDVSGSYTPGQVQVDNGLSVDNEALSVDGMTLTLDVSGSVDGTAYTFDIANSVVCLADPTTFVVRACRCNLNGDGWTNMIDKANVVPFKGQTANAEKAFADVNQDGWINAVDLSVPGQYNGRPCPGPAAGSMGSAVLSIESPGSVYNPMSGMNEIAAPDLRSPTFYVDVMITSDDPVGMSAFGITLDSDWPLAYRAFENFAGNCLNYSGAYAMYATRPGMPNHNWYQGGGNCLPAGDLPMAGPLADEEVGTMNEFGRFAMNGLAVWLEFDTLLGDLDCIIDADEVVPPYVGSSAFARMNMTVIPLRIYAPPCEMVSVASWKTHANGPWPITDDHPRDGFLITETRQGGLEWIEVTFGQDVSSRYVPGQVQVTPALNIDNEALSDDGMTLRLDVSGSVNRTAYTFDLASSVPWLLPDETTFRVRACLGNTNGDGYVNQTDKAQTGASNGHVADLTHAFLDVNLDGWVNNIDKSFVASLSGVFCAD